MGDLRPVNDRNYNVCGRLRQRKRPYTFVYDRRKHRPGTVFYHQQVIASNQVLPVNNSGVDGNGGA